MGRHRAGDYIVPLELTGEGVGATEYAAGAVGPLDSGLVLVIIDVGVAITAGQGVGYFGVGRADHDTRDGRRGVGDGDRGASRKADPSNPVIRGNGTYEGVASVDCVRQLRVGPCRSAVDGPLDC